MDFSFAVFSLLGQVGLAVNQVEAQLPVSFFVACLVAAVFIFEALVKWNEPWAKPALAVYGTVSVWYLFEILYLNPEWHFSRFEPHIIDAAFFQVLLFFIAFRFGCFLTQGLWKPALQYEPLAGESVFHGFSSIQGRNVLKVMALIWVALASFAIFFLHEGDILGTLYPFISDRRMWARAGGAGAGTMGFVISSAGYIYMFTCAFMGVLFVMQKDRTTRFWCLVLILLAWPALLFSWARNTVLAITVPAVICYVLFSDHALPRKFVTILVLFLVFNFWMLAMLETRERGFQGFFDDFRVTDYLGFGAESAEQEERGARHTGLNMFGELCYMNQFLEDGTYQITMGRRYFAEAVNFVPRFIWPNKPLIGIDYAVARGFGGADSDTGVHATIATGMIGQGVSNFGGFFGPIAAAFLMSLWVAFLTRLWLQRKNILRMGLFLFAMALTFNMGRDITLLVIWPVIFGYVGIRAYEMLKQRQGIDLNAHHPAPVTSAT